jgi:hypothetical protein
LLLLSPSHRCSVRGLSRRIESLRFLLWVALEECCISPQRLAFKGSWTHDSSDDCPALPWPSPHMRSPIANEDWWVALVSAVPTVGCRDTVSHFFTALHGGRERSVEARASNSNFQQHFRKSCIYRNIRQFANIHHHFAKSAPCPLLERVYRTLLLAPQCCFVVKRQEFSAAAWLVSALRFSGHHWAVR